MLTKPGDLLGEAIEQGVSIVKQTAKTVADTPAAMAKTAVQQVGGTSSSKDAGEAKDVVKQQKSVSQSDPQTASDADTKAFVKELYGAVDTTGTKAKASKTLEKLVEENPNKSPEELQKLEMLRQQLHKQTYYDPTFNSSKSQEEPVTERLEREEQEEKMEELEKKKKKPKDLALQHAQQSTEKFRGAAG